MTLRFGSSYPPTRAAGEWPRLPPSVLATVEEVMSSAVGDLLWVPLTDLPAASTPTGA